MTLTEHYEWVKQQELKKEKERLEKERKEKERKEREKKEQERKSRLAKLHAQEKKKQEGKEEEGDKVEEEADKNSYKPMEDVKQMDFNNLDKQEKVVKHYKDADEALDSIG